MASGGGPTSHGAARAPPVVRGRPRGRRHPGGRDGRCSWPRTSPRPGSSRARPSSRPWCCSPAPPTRGPAAPAWRLVGLGLGLWAAASRPWPRRSTAASRRSRRTWPTVPSWPGSSSSASALVIMALDRAMRDDWIARIDAVIVGVGCRRGPRRVPLARAPGRRPQRGRAGRRHRGGGPGGLPRRRRRPAGHHRCVRPAVGPLRDRGRPRAGGGLDPRYAPPSWS